MKIREIFNRVDNFKSSEWGNEQKLEWLNTLEGEIYDDVVLTHENPNNITYTEHETDNEDVIAPDRFCDMYIFYLLMQIDLFNGDLNRYNADAALYMEKRNDFNAWYNRTYTPKQITQITY